ncbi:MAG: hypothetical protein HWE30_00400 [Methylocystaceae bacterium]|nr:hypothetical protein [Methylocystaceae bacterium]
MEVFNDQKVYPQAAAKSVVLGIIITECSSGCDFVDRSTLPDPRFCPPPKPGSAGMLYHMGNDLSGADKVVFERILEKHSPQITDHLAHMDDMLCEIAILVEQDPFSMDDFQKAHQTFDQVKFKMDRDIANFLYEVLPALSPAGRKKPRLLPPHLEDKK